MFFWRQCAPHTNDWSFCDIISKPTSKHSPIRDIGQGPQDGSDRGDRCGAYTARSVRTWWNWKPRHTCYWCVLYIYNEGRSRVFRIIDANYYHEFSSYNAEEKLVFIVKNIDPSVARFIFDSFELRAFLLSKPKRNYQVSCQITLLSFYLYYVFYVTFVIHFCMQRGSNRE